MRSDADERVASNARVRIEARVSDRRARLQQRSVGRIGRRDRTCGQRVVEGLGQRCEGLAGLGQADRARDADRQCFFGDERVQRIGTEHVVQRVQPVQLTGRVHPAHDVVRCLVRVERVLEVAQCVLRGLDHLPGEQQKVVGEHPSGHRQRRFFHECPRRRAVRRLLALHLHRELVEPCAQFGQRVFAERVIAAEGVLHARVVVAVRRNHHAQLRRRREIRGIGRRILIGRRHAQIESEMRVEERLHRVKRDRRRIVAGADEHFVREPVQ
ncbi:Uncharacterised protein [Burkholderia pseudomallei]|nr:Uncharacterised protein [Burkholderia pseudomallei]